MQRRTWLIIHGWLGANLSLLTALLFLSGTLATVSHEIDWLADCRVRAAGIARNISWDRLRDIVSAATPGERITMIMVGPERVLVPEWDLPFAARISLRDFQGSERILFFDMQSTHITGTRSYVDFPFLVRQLHYNLFVHPVGFYLNVVIAGMVLGAIVTGLVTYRCFWRGFFRVPRWHAARRVFWGDVHRLAALWSLCFLLLVSITGFWYVVPELLMRFGRSADTPITIAQADAPMLPLDMLAAKATAAIPGFDIRLILLPERSGGEIEFWGQAGEALMHNRGNRVRLNSETGEVVSLHRSSQKGAFVRWIDTADALHFGSFGGLVGRLAWFIFGLTTSLLIISGTVIRAYRLSGEIGWRLTWLGRWRLLNLALLFLPTGGLLALMLA